MGEAKEVIKVKKRAIWVASRTPGDWRQTGCVNEERLHFGGAVTVCGRI